MNGSRCLFIASVTGIPCASAADHAMSYLQTYGPAADDATVLQYGLMAISIAVIAIVTALLLYGCLRRRSASHDSDQIGSAATSTRRESDDIGMRWIYVGVGITIPVLLACVVWTLITLAAIAAPAAANVVIEVHGHQWWWELRYTDANPDRQFTTANEIHIPVGEPVQFRLLSDDVIHSFWVPRLAGKTDMVPGQTNLAWMEARRAGEYRGQCGEFCGAQHAHMALIVIAEPRAQFDAWRRAQLQPSVSPQQNSTAHGRDVVAAHCGKCHTVRGTSAAGTDGPDLTHLMSRGTIAAAELRNNKGNLSGWVADPQALKPGALMPASDLSPRELGDVVNYLLTLQ